MMLNRTGLVYDEVMLSFFCDWDLNYPEHPDRIRKPFERCEFYGLVEKCVRLKVIFNLKLFIDRISSKLLRIFFKGRYCTDDELKVNHSDIAIENLKRSEHLNMDQRMDLSAHFDSVFFHPESNRAVRYAVGSSLDLLDSILEDRVDNGFAIIRPPGHHAMHDEPNGYCYFNTASILAKTAIQKHGLERVLIVDWDGNF